MKRIGLLGGMSWESSIEYYRLVNEAVRTRLGGLHSADCLLRSVDFAAIEQLQRAGDWDSAADILVAEARPLADAGAELHVLCTNTMHKVAGPIPEAVEIPFVHIADTTAEAVRGAGLRTVGPSRPRTPWSRTSTPADCETCTDSRSSSPARTTAASSMT